MKWVRAITMTAAGLGLGAVAACGAQGGAVSGDAVANQAQAQPAAAAPYDAPANNSTGVGVQATRLAATEAGSLGQIVTDGDGRSVYRFDKDTAKPPQSNCAGDCAVNWPPLLTTDPASIAVEGIDKALIGEVARADGTKQVTIGGWPAYRFAKDAAAGDVKGQGVGGTWFAFTPAGKKASDKNAAPAVALTVMKVGKLGPIVTDKDGMTLYRFDKDTANPSKSNCEGDCAAKWPPVIVPQGAQFQLNGVDQANVGTVARSDGSMQLTVGGWPMYRFAGDAKSCDTNGQGLGGVWWATKATGARAK
jgi:predicted lipoprotein with Yx(FWY)xxD motif